MHKRIGLFLLLFAISSVAGLKSIAASPDCDKWLKQYQEELANAAPIKRIVHHVHHFTHPTPKKPVQVAAIPPVHRPIVPKLTPAEALRRFHVLCDTPEDQADITPSTTDTLIAIPALAPPPTEIASVVVPPLPGSPIAPNLPVATVTPILPPPPQGAPGIPIIPGGPGPDLPISPTPPPPTTPIPPPVPEPSSIILILTGAAGVAGKVFRRKR